MGGQRGSTFFVENICKETREIFARIVEKEIEKARAERAREFEAAVDDSGDWLAAGWFAAGGG